MATLGERLKKQIDDRAAQDQAIQNAKDAAEKKKLEEHRATITLFLNHIKEYITKSIDDNVQLKNAKLLRTIAADNQYWGYHYWSVINGRLVCTGFDVTFNEIIDWGVENGLKIEYVYNHDGIGMESWYEIKVQPLV